jgi:anti-sigma-K factor RskA
MIKDDAERGRIEFLLPWYAAGTLSHSDTDCVEQALAGDCELARRYARVLEELAETINLNEALGEPSAGVAERLFAAIDAEEARATRRRLQRPARNTARGAGASLPSEPK